MGIQTYQYKFLNTLSEIFSQPLKFLIFRENIFAILRKVFQLIKIMIYHEHYFSKYICIKTYVKSPTRLFKKPIVSIFH